MIIFKLPKISVWGCFVTCLILSGLAVNAQVNNNFTVNNKVINQQSFDTEINRMIKEVGIPAVSLAIIDQGKIIYFNTYGVKSLGSNTPAGNNSVFEACSLSKSFLVYAAYQLVDQGKLDLDKPIYQYLEPGPMLDHDARYRLITPRMILSHSSGLEDWPNENNTHQMDIISQPGAKFNYSSLGYNYLAAAIETIVKEPYDTYMQRMVLTPLNLQNTYVKFKNDTIGKTVTTSPADFVTGHDNFGKEFGKWKNYESVASSGVSTTAKDYANLILNIFSAGKLSANSVNQILKPVVHTGSANTPYYYGTGFEIIHTGTDTIIGHGGSNPGFKAQIFYSTTHKRGLVFLTNSDLGKIITSRVNEMTAGLDITDYYQQFSVDQYPSKAITLLNIYKSAGSKQMFAEANRLHTIDSLGINTLNQLGKLFINQDTLIAKQLLGSNIGFFPQSAYAHLLMGDLYDKNDNYTGALAEYERAKQLDFKLWDIQPDIDEYRKKVNEARAHSKITTHINKNQVLYATNYSAMRGIDVDDNNKKDPLPNVSGGAGSWLEYNMVITKPGTYKLHLYVANDDNNGTFELVINNTKFTRFKSALKPSGDWVYKIVEIKLKPGRQTLRLNFNSGTTRIKSIRFS